MVANPNIYASPNPRDLRESLGVSRERMARMLDVSAKTIERWEMHGSPPTSNAVRERFAQLRDIAQIGRMVYTPEGFVQYLNTPLPALGGRTAIKLIERGESEHVLAALASDYEGLGS